MKRPDLTNYDNPYIPNLIERQYNQGLALGEDLEKAYREINKLLEESDQQSKRTPEGMDVENIYRSEEEIDALSAVRSIHDWLDNDQIQVFERDPVGTVKHFARLSEGWERRGQSDFAAGNLGYDQRDGIEGRKVGKRTMGFAWTLEFQPTPAGEQRINSILAAAKGAADQLSSEEGQEVMRSLLDKFEELTQVARGAVDTLEEAAEERFRSHDHEQQEDADRYAGRLLSHLG